MDVLHRIVAETHNDNGSQFYAHLFACQVQYGNWVDYVQMFPEFLYNTIRQKAKRVCGISAIYALMYTRI